MIDQQERVVFIAPPQVCSWCARLTHMAMLTGKHCLEPLCAWHGFTDYVGDAPTKKERRAVFASVERFVLAFYGMVGRATVISIVKPDEVPGYEPAERALFTDRAFYCKYADAEGQARYCWVVWYVDALEFWLAEQDSPLDQASV